MLCVSKNSLGSDWARLECQTSRFRDPSNRAQRLIPVRLDDAEPTGLLSNSCTPTGAPAMRASSSDCCAPGFGEAKAGPEEASTPLISLGHTNNVNAVACSPDGIHAITASDDHTARV